MKKKHKSEIQGKVYDWTKINENDPDDGRTGRPTDRRTIALVYRCN